MASKLDKLQVSTCICGNLRKTTRVVTQFYDTALKPVGIKPGQFTVLAALSIHGQMRITELAKLLEIDRTTMIRNVRLLEKKELVQTATDDRTSYSVLVLTRAGKERLEKALPHWQKAQAQIKNYLGQDRWGGLLDDLSSTISATKE
ncbi:MAG: MarR family winged helix-turn-helix transcriptional regulator [Proteobacteria bacterium]|nr:MarR family winged helix-turn-helix transcriptional regulator [Pseudomonadota bacterium]